jgi:hypothetical protein
MAEDVYKLADSSVNLPERWIYELHDSWRKKQFGDVNITSDFIRYFINSLYIVGKLGIDIPDINLR